MKKACLSKSKFWLCSKLNYLEYIDDFYKITAEKEKPHDLINGCTNFRKNERKKIGK